MIASDKFFISHHLSLTVYYVHLDAARLDEGARVAGVLAAVLHPRLLDDERAHRRRGLVCQHAHAAPRGRVIDGL